MPAMPPFTTGSKFPKHSWTGKAKVNNSDSKNCAKWSMTFTQFKLFLSWCKAHPRYKWLKTNPTGPPGQPKKVKGYVNGHELNEHFVKPWTKGTGAGVALCMNQAAPKSADLMVSHSWNENIEELEEAVQVHLAGRGLGHSTAIWFCIFGLYQPNDLPAITVSKQCEYKPPPFEQAIAASSKKKGMVLAHTSQDDMYDRIWCCYELFIAQSKKSEGGYECKCFMGSSTHYKIKIAVEYKTKQVDKLYINCKNAKASAAADKKFIHGQIAKNSKYTWEKMNAIVYANRFQLAKMGATYAKSGTDAKKIAAAEKAWYAGHAKRSAEKQAQIGKWNTLIKASGLKPIDHQKIRMKTTLAAFTTK